MKQPATCADCGKTFTSEGFLNKHRRAAHEASGTPPPPATETAKRRNGKAPGGVSELMAALLARREQCEHEIKALDLLMETYQP